MRAGLDQIQEALQQEGLDGWLFVDHHHRDPLAYRLLGLAEDLTPTRRWYYLIPSSGEPVKLVHRIESHILDQLPGKKETYASWSEHQARLGSLLSGMKKVAMQYSPRCAIPYVAMVDAGTVELVRSFGVQVCSSADLVQSFLARWTSAQLDSHREAGRRVDRILSSVFRWIGERLRAGEPTTEWDAKLYLVEAFRREGLRAEHGPIVAVDQHSGDPHYEPFASRHSPIHQGSWVLIDVWAKVDRPGTVYYDVTWTGYCGTTVPTEHQNVFDVVIRARDKVLDTLRRAVEAGETVRGYQLDDVARSIIRQAGYGAFFPHRTGHSLGEEVHGVGANLDNWETHDERRILPGTGFTIEPGIYLEAFGVRSEINVFVEERQVLVTSPVQTEPVRIV